MPFFDPRQLFELALELHNVAILIKLDMHPLVEGRDEVVDQEVRPCDLTDRLV